MNVDFHESLFLLNMEPEIFFWPLDAKLQHPGFNFEPWDIPRYLTWLVNKFSLQCNNSPSFQSLHENTRNNFGKKNLSLHVLEITCQRGWLLDHSKLVFYHKIIMSKVLIKLLVSSLSFDQEQNQSSLTNSIVQCSVHWLIILFFFILSTNESWL